MCLVRWSIKRLPGRSLSVGRLSGTRFRTMALSTRGRTLARVGSLSPVVTPTQSVARSSASARTGTSRSNLLHRFECVCVFGFNKKDIFVQERKRSRSRSPTRKPRVRSSRAFRSPSPPRPAQSEFVVDVCAPIVDACASNDFIADCLLFSSPLLC